MAQYANGFQYDRTIGDPAMIVAQQSLTVNQQACVTATATRRGGDTLPGVALELTVTGANPQQASGTTGPTGDYKFCYTGANAGTDSLTVKLAGAPAALTRAKAALAASATVQWEAAPLPPPTPTPTPMPTPTPVVKNLLPIKIKGEQASPVQLAFWPVPSPPMSLARSSSGTLAGP